MQAPTVDYRKLRLSNINSPEYRHLLLLLGWVGYFVLYFITENLIPAEKCHPIYCRLDDFVPFCEWFVIAYVSWYLLIVGSILYFLLYSVESFKKMQTYIIVTQIIAMSVYIIYPNCQNLRPETFPRENVLTWILGSIYAFDTNTGVCPSLHVAYSAGIASTWLREKRAPKWLKTVITVWCAVICVSVAFVKQHSVVDIFAAIPVCIFAEWFVFFRKRGRERRWGDRSDGRRVRTAQVMEQVTAFFMPNRNGANNLFSDSVEISETEKYIRRKRREGMKGFGLTHVVLAAYVRTVAKYPALNRFIAGQRIYSREDDIVICMTIKKQLTASAPDSLVKVHLHPADTAFDVYSKFNAKVEEAKNEMETTADGMAAAFMKIPRLLLKFAVWFLKTLDYFGLVPAALLEISPFHGSVYFTNMGSLGIKPVYHHLYDFGTVPVFCAFGCKRRAEELKDGETVERKYLDLNFNLDERICDGFYYANAIKYFLRLMTNPEVLDEKPEVIEKDIM